MKICRSTTPRAASSRTPNVGFSLLELLVVVAIIALLTSYVAPRMRGQLSKGEQATARAQIDALVKALEAYRMDTGHYPAASVGLSALTARPDGETKWGGPYLQKALPLDPWGAPYRYTIPGRASDYEVASLGSDRRPGGDGDAADLSSTR
jgi:general secretion pathway protein G